MIANGRKTAVMIINMINNTFFAVFFLFISCASSFPNPGISSETLYKESDYIFGTHKPLYRDSSIHLSVNCEPESSHQKIKIQWLLRQTSCYEDYLASDIYTTELLRQYFKCPMASNSSPKIRFFRSKEITLECSNRIHLEYVNATLELFNEKTEIPPECGNFIIPTLDSKEDKTVIPVTKSKPDKIELPTVNSKTEKSMNEKVEDSILTKPTAQQVTSTVASKNHSEVPKSENDIGHQRKKRSEELQEVKGAVRNESTSVQNSHSYVYVPLSSANVVKVGTKLTSVDMDGIYLFILKVEGVEDQKFNFSVDIVMKGEHGFLSAVDYPLLIFYGVMCGLYVIYAVVWLILSALQWRDLLRIQFWIGAVILLGLIEKAVFYAEYQSINYTGQSVQGAILFAEILSCMKRTLARMLIIIVSLGFGIVKPRLGPTLHRIIGIGALYFCLGSLEGCLRVLKPKTDPGNQALMAGIPLAVTDSAICWWIFSSLVQTIRTLRLRRNIVKLQLYRHFTNTLLASVVGSVAFMTWSIHAHKLVSCISDWKEIWVDEAYWHFLFSTILFVIMILWRPTQNNQRYAFTPLLDAMDEDDDDEDNLLPTDVFAGMKMRTTKTSSNNSPHAEDTKSKQDEDLKWVEENIPPSITDVALPSLMDSDEEIMTAKFERSKME